MAVKIIVEAFWVVMLCGVAVGYRHFGGPSCLHLQVQVHVGILPQALHGVKHRRPRLVVV